MRDSHKKILTVVGTIVFVTIVAVITLSALWESFLPDDDTELVYIIAMLLMSPVGWVVLLFILGIFVLAARLSLFGMKTKKKKQRYVAVNQDSGRAGTDISMREVIIGLLSQNGAMTMQSMANILSADQDDVMSELRKMLQDGVIRQDIGHSPVIFYITPKE